MIDPFLKAKAEKLAEQLSGSIPFDEIEAKYKAASPKEQKQVDEIKKMSAAYIKAKDFEGLQRYLKYIRTIL